MSLANIGHGPQWFATQPSACTKRLHPPLDPTDSFDPTFLGITRKKHVPGPESKVFRPDKGKKLSPLEDERGLHGLGLIRQDTYCKPLNTESNLSETRFQKGFVRRKLAQMDLGPRRDDANRDAENLARKAEQDVARSKFLAGQSNRNGFNPVNNLKPICGDFVEVRPGHKNRRTKETIATMVAVGKDTENERAVHEFRREQRKDKIVREGLAGIRGGTVKDWSVRQQMHCGDGFP